MVYTKARLDEALQIVRETNADLKRRGIKPIHLDSQPSRKYELRRPPSDRLFIPRLAPWNFADDSDGEFNPSLSRKTKKSAQESKRTKSQRKHKLSVSGDSDSEKKQRNIKGTTWAQGRRLGRSSIQTFNFKTPENIEALKQLANLHGRGEDRMPQEQHVNVFNVNALDSGFARPPISKDLQEKDSKATEAQTQQDQKPPSDTTTSFGLNSVAQADLSQAYPTPRSSIASHEALTQNGIPQNSDVATNNGKKANNDISKPHTPISTTAQLTPLGALPSCLTCSEIGNECSLPTARPEYQGKCDHCDEVGTTCRLKRGDRPRGKFSIITSKERQNELEENFLRRTKRQRPEDGQTFPDRTTSSNFTESNHDTKRIKTGLGTSLLTKKLNGGTKNVPNQECLSTVIGTNNFLDNVRQPRYGTLESFKESLASISKTTKKQPFIFDIGNPNFPFTKAAPSRADISMGNSRDRAISISSTSSSPTVSRTPSPDPTPRGSPLGLPQNLFAPTPTNMIMTRWAHPISFNHEPLQSGIPCHFCADFRYGILGHPLRAVEVAWDTDAKHYIELGQGYMADGYEATRMCVACVFERLRIRFCGVGESMIGDEKTNDTNNNNNTNNTSGKDKETPVVQEDQVENEKIHNNHQVVMVQTSKIKFELWAKQIKLMPHNLDYKAQWPTPGCSLCMLPATHCCITPQKRDRLLRPLTTTSASANTNSDGGGNGNGNEGKKIGCGLRLCSTCAKKMNDGKGTWDGRDEVDSGFFRADAEFMFEGSLLDIFWRDYLKSVELA